MKINGNTIRQRWCKWRSMRWTRVIFHTARSADAQDIFTHVAALTYSTVLSVVPLLALMLALGRGFGMQDYIEVQLRQNLNTSDDVIGQLMNFANSYIARTHDDVVLGVSGLVLAFTIVSLVNNIERRFNTMWGVNTSRSLFGFSLSYLGLIVFLAFSIFFLSGVWVFILQLLNYLPHHVLVDTTMPLLVFLLKSLVFSAVLGAMFRFIPLVKVEVRHILWPALITGTLFSLVQQFYIEGQMFLSSYNAVYGSFAVLPLLMAWVYATWTIVLVGVLLCRSLQATENNEDLFDQKTYNHRSHDLVALRIMALMARRFVDNKPPLMVKEWAEKLAISTEFAGMELQRLAEVGLIFRVVEVSEVTLAPLPSTAVFKVNVDVHQLTAEEVVKRLNQQGNVVEMPLSSEALQQYHKIVENYGTEQDLQRNILEL